MFFVKRYIEVVLAIIDRLGFDPLYVGTLAAGQRLEPGGNIFGADVEKDSLRNLLQT